MNDKDTSLRRGEGVGFIRLLPSIIVVLAAAIGLPLATNLYVGGAASCICALFLLLSARKKVPVLLLLLLLCGVFGLPDGLPMITVILALIVGTGTYAWLISYTNHSPLVAIIPVLAYVTATVVTKSWFVSLLALAFAIPALVLAFAFKGQATRLSGICRVSATFLITAAVAVIGGMLYLKGRFSLDMLKDYADILTASITKILAETSVELMNGETAVIFAEEDAYNAAHRMVTLLPALIILAANALAFFAQRLQFSLIRTSMGDDAISGNSIAFITSPFSGGAYILSFLVYVLSDSTPLGETVSTVCENIFILLTPALIGMGIMYFFAQMAVRRIKAGPLILLAVAALLFINLTSAVLLIACFGAYASIAIPILRHLKEKENKD